MRIAAQHTFVLLLVLAIQSTAGRQQIYNVFDFHAAGDAKTDDAQAFLETWQAACNDSSWPILVIPGGKTFLLSQIKFQGPCKSPVTIQLDGNIVAPDCIWTTKAGNLLTFFSVDNLTLDGYGQIDGKGAIWWTCYNQKRCSTRPILLAFSRCNNLWVRNIHLQNSADKHMTLFQCSQVNVHNVSITAPGDSPNTDGINMAISHHVHISSCTFETGDDCVSILSNTTDVNITQSICGPGHGISVGSLGGDEPALVEGITVSYCNFYGTMNGVRIKSWQGGKGYARGFLFQNIKMTGVQNPIIIDQFYCPQGNCPPKDGGVAISDARFINIQGTSSEQQAIKFLCSESVPCRDVYLRDINLTWANHTAPANATILNAHGTTSGIVIPKCESMEAVQRRLKEMGIRYVQRRVEEGGIYVDQLFFHDPDGFMIEICTCDNLPVIPLMPDAHAVIGRTPKQQQQQPPVPTAVPTAVPVPEKANGGGCVAGEVVVDAKHIPPCAMRSCPEHPCMQV